MQSESIVVETATGVQRELTLAGAGSRAYAYAIDWHLRAGLVLLWLAFAWILLPPFRENGGAASATDLMLWFGVPVLLYGLYHPVVELASQGGTPGKRMAGLRCVDLDGNRVGSGPILLRNVMRLVDGLPAFYTIGLITVMLSKEQQRLGDMLAGTRIVVAPEDSQRALDALEEVQLSGLAPKDAELVRKVLDRWSTLEPVRRRDVARTLLQRLGNATDDPLAGPATKLRDAELKHRLAELLKRS
ncbi:MAG: RDD family protein [Pseudomonadota bacterium]